MKKKLTEQQKTILFYSGELLVFSIVFLLLGILRITGIIEYKETRRIIFNCITLAGFAWGVTDFIWTLVSPKRRAKSCLLDKCLVFPLAIYLCVFDLISFINAANNSTQFYVIGIAVVFFYASAIYLVQAIYHYFKPLPILLEGEKKDEPKDPSSNETK